MRREITETCSSYLCRPARSLPEACRDITRRHRTDPPPCEACPLADLCDRRSGKRWFDFLCARRDLVPETAWRALVGRHFKGALKPPFNIEARRAAGLAPSFYAPRAIGKSRAPAPR